VASFFILIATRIIDLVILSSKYHLTFTSLVSIGICVALFLFLFLILNLSPSSFFAQNNNNGRDGCNVVVGHCEQAAKKKVR